MEIKGSANAQNIFDLIQKKLDEFQIQNSKIVSFCSDGAATMIACGRKMNCIHTTCFLHTLHLVICDSIYAKKEDFVIEDSESDSDALIEDEYDFIDQVHHPTQINEKFHSVIMHVRKIVKYFSKSARREEILLNHAKEIPGCSPVKLCLDVKTRWSSLIKMLKVFISMLPAIRMAFVTENSIYEISNTQIDSIKSLISALSPFEEAVTFLSKSNVNYFDAVCTINFLRNALKNQTSSIGADLLKHLNSRVNSRMSRELMNFCLTINNPKTCLDDFEMREDFKLICTTFLNNYSAAEILSEPPILDNLTENPIELSIENEKKKLLK